MSDIADDILSELDAVFKESTVSVTPVVEEPSELVETHDHTSFSEVFKLRSYRGPGNFPVKKCDEADAPSMPPGWVFPSETYPTVMAMMSGLTVRLVGPPTTGKSDLAEAIAHQLGRPLLRISCHENMLVEDLVGKTTLVAGETRFVHGLLPKYWTRPAIICWDEVSRLPRGVALGLLQRSLEPGRVLPVVENNEFIKGHPDLIIMATDNTLGLGDDMDKYGSHVQDMSTLTRWNVTVKMDYMTSAQFKKVLLGKVEINADHAERIAKFAKQTQAAFESGKVSLPFGLRQAVPAAVLGIKLNDMPAALQLTYSNSLYGEEKAAIEGIIKTLWK